MLKGIDPLLTADLLRALRAMGHGDEIAIVDANFPAASLGPPLIELPGVGAPESLAAILTLLPVDALATPAALTMALPGDAPDLPEVVADFAAIFTERGLADCEIGQLDRPAFHERARRAFAIVRTGELRPYGNILLVKGALHSHAPPR
jgi:L-fucose mutarotase